MTQIKAEPQKSNVIAEEKDAIRKAMRERRHTVRDSERLAAAEKISNHLSVPPVDLFARTYMICVYLSTGHEIPTRYIVRKAWESGKFVCVPAWDPMERAYMLFEFNPQIKLVTGKFGIREPVVRIPVQPFDVTAFILPGLAFDMQGGRLGYGGGYYDRILSQSSQAALHIGICYDWQIQDKPLPQEKHDRRLNWIVSEKRIIHCSTGEVTTPLTIGPVP